MRRHPLGFALLCAAALALAPACDKLVGDFDFTSSSTASGSGGHTSSSTGGTTSSSTGGMTCMAGLQECGAGCVDLTGDPHHCGACNNDCGPSAVCNMGTCGCKMTMGAGLYCGAIAGCVSGDTPEHCGGCSACPNAGDTCNGGMCVCAMGTKDCGSGCVDLGSDPLDCGMCGNHCDVRQACQGAACACRAGTTACGSQCVDLQHDPNHCGSCASACPGGHACDAGMCVSVCPMGTTSCNGGCYASFGSDPANCGACGKACTVEQVCVGGACKSYFFPQTGCMGCPCPACDAAGDTCCPIPVGAYVPAACVAGTGCPGSP